MSDKACQSASTEREQQKGEANSASYFLLPTTATLVSPKQSSLGVNGPRQLASPRLCTRTSLSAGQVRAKAFVVTDRWLLFAELSVYREGGRKSLLRDHRAQRCFGGSRVDSPGETGRTGWS